MTGDDSTDRGHMDKLREEMDEKGPLKAVRDDMSHLKDRVKDAVSDDDTAAEMADEPPTQPDLDDEPRVDQDDASTTLDGDRPSERSKAAFNRK